MLINIFSAFSCNEICLRDTFVTDGRSQHQACGGRAASCVGHQGIYLHAWTVWLSTFLMGTICYRSLRASFGNYMVSLHLLPRDQAGVEDIPGCLT